MEQKAPDLVIILLTGKENAKRLPSAFFLASTAAAEDMNVVVYFTGPATELLKRVLRTASIQWKADSHFLTLLSSPLTTVCRWLHANSPLTSTV